MTNQPDRPDKDGLLLKLAKKCRGQAANIGHNDRSINPVGLLLDVADALEKVIANQPTRDGAEGADNFTYGVDHCVHDERQRSTPPKPAPDVMQNETVFQNALCDRIEAWRALPQYANVTLVDWLRDAGIIATPVPSPDGARWRHRKRGTTYTEIGRGNMQIATDPVAEDASVVIYQSDVDGRIWVRGEAEFQDGRFEAIPPPPAVAAEQVAWRNRVKFLKVDGTWRDDDGIDAVLDEFLSAIESFYASPTVRGDREAIAETVADIIFNDDLENLDGNKQDACRHLADAILSLPVQPGAGERGALVERCAKIAEPWPGFWLDENSTDVDRAVVAVRTEIAEKIRAVRP